MSTRSAQNKRTQEKLQGESRPGMARKSASSAKPARAAASSVRVVPSSAKAKRAAAERGEDLSSLSKAERKARKAELRRQEDRVYTASNTLLKEDKDYVRYRRVWWVLLALGIAALVGTWVLLAVYGQNAEVPQAAQTAQMVMIVAAYAAIIIAFIFDFIKIRPIRNACRATASGMSTAKLDEVIARSMKDGDSEGKESKK